MQIKTIRENKKQSIAPHSEGGGATHPKASAAGPRSAVLTGGGRHVLGTWQGIDFCAFAPPRSKEFYVKAI